MEGHHAFSVVLSRAFSRLSPILCEDVLLALALASARSPLLVTILLGSGEWLARGTFGRTYRLMHELILRRHGEVNCP